jgi:hypothetical protein
MEHKMELELKFHTVFEEKDGVHIATCIEMGLVAVADRKEDLSAIMDKLIHRQISFAMENDNFQDIFHPAELAWQFLRDGLAKKKFREERMNVERISGAKVTNTAYAAAAC